MKIEVEWKAKPMSGVTEIELSDLGIKSKKEWMNISESKKQELINKYLQDTDKIAPIVVDYWTM